MQILFSLDVAEFLDGCLPLAAFFHAFMTVCDRHHPHKTSAALHYSSPFSFLKSKTSISKHFSKKKSFAVQYHSVYCIKTLKKSQFTKKIEFSRIIQQLTLTQFLELWPMQTLWDTFALFSNTVISMRYFRYWRTFAAEICLHNSEHHFSEWLQWFNPNLY